jgi:hypothetical protein
MNNYDLHQSLKKLWDKSIAQYRSGQRGAETFFSEEDSALLRGIGHGKQEFYDFVEDNINYEGDPDFETFLLIALPRIVYFRTVLNSQPANKIVDTGDLPGKRESVRGVEWLPRLIPKAKAKLRGEMSDDLMYLCAGDRAFFKEHNIHPAEFLTFVSHHMEDDDAVVDFVISRSESSSN